MLLTFWTVSLLLPLLYFLFRLGLLVCVILFCFLDVGVNCDYLEAVTETDVSKRGFGVRN